VFPLIGWLGRILLVTFAARALLNVVMPPKRVPGGPGQAGPRPQGPGGSGSGPRPPQPERVGGQLVRDPQCGTYVPESRAIKVTVGATIRHFCSDKCRQEYTAAHA
jgi:hypothetical protein